MKYNKYTEDKCEICCANWINLFVGRKFIYKSVKLNAQLKNNGQIEKILVLLQ